MSFQKIGLLISAFIILNNFSFAQRNCGTTTYFEQIQQKDPDAKARLEGIRAKAKAWAQKNAPTTKGQLITIPVVVHVVYENGTENIPDAQVESQIAVLNEDFRRLNADASNTPSYFTDIAADSEIEFCLAQRDPNGNATNGITRTSTTVSSFNTNNDVKFTSSGGKDAWPRTDYLNLWVCDLGGGLLGYAQFPGSGSASTDGVVINYPYFGSSDYDDGSFSISSPFDLGRTCTHEVGHWLGLYHTFQGGCSGTSPSDCDSQGDGICDTPPTSQSNYSCPSNDQNTCTESPVDYNDMHMNYMDYVNDECMNMFSEGQKEVMLGVMNGTRSSLLSSDGCVPPTLPQDDAGISNIITPDGGSCVDTLDPEVVLENFGSATLTSVTINYDLDGSTGTYNWTGSLATNDTAHIHLPIIVTTTGKHVFEVYTTNPNGNTDTNNYNDGHIHHLECFVPNDARVTLLSPEDTSCGYNAFQPVIEVTNDGGDTLQTLTINYQLDGGSTATYSWSGSLANGETEEVELPALEAAAGTHDLLVYSTDPNGSSDGYTTNDTASITFLMESSNLVNVTFVMDNGLAQFVSWWIKDSLGTTIDSIGGYGDNTTNYHEVCLTKACNYTFTVNDPVGNGICCDNGNGYYLLENALGDTLAFGGDFGYDTTHSLCVENWELSTNTSIEEKSRQAVTAIALFPNPTDNKVNLQLGESGLLHIRIFDIVGRKVYEQQHPDYRKEKLNLDLSGLKSGTYFVQLDINGKQTTEKLLLFDR